MSKEIREVYEALLPHLITEDMATYHSKSKDYLSSGKLKMFRDDSPALFKADLEGELPEFDSVAYAVGRAAHTLILEGEDAYKETYKSVALSTIRGNIKTPLNHMEGTQRSSLSGVSSRALILHSY